MRLLNISEPWPGFLMGTQWRYFRKPGICVGMALLRQKIEIYADGHPVAPVDKGAWCIKERTGSIQ